MSIEQNKENCRRFLVDAGVGTASDACITMEQGVDGILMNTALAEAAEGRTRSLGGALLRLRQGRVEIGRDLRDQLLPPVRREHLRAGLFQVRSQQQ